MTQRDKQRYLEMIQKLATKLVTAAHHRGCVRLSDNEIASIAYELNSLAMSLTEDKMPPYPKVGQVWAEPHRHPVALRRQITKLTIGTLTASGITMPTLVHWRRPGTTREPYRCTLGHWTRKAIRCCWRLEEKTND